MNTAAMLSEIIRFNRDMMQTARERMSATADDMEGAEWQTAYQIYRDCEKAFDDAKRAAKYGMPGVN
jgi:hypothetical protein